MWISLLGFRGPSLVDSPTFDAPLPPCCNAIAIQPASDVRGRGGAGPAGAAVEQVTSGAAVLWAQFCWCAFCTATPTRQGVGNTYGSTRALGTASGNLAREAANVMLGGEPTPMCQRRKVLAAMYESVRAGPCGTMWHPQQQPLMLLLPSVLASALAIDKPVNANVQQDTAVPRAKKVSRIPCMMPRFAAPAWL